MIKLIKSIQQIKFASNQLCPDVITGSVTSCFSQHRNKELPRGRFSDKMEKKSGILLWEESHTSVSPGKSTADLLTEVHRFGLLSNN